MKQYLCLLDKTYRILIFLGVPLAQTVCLIACMNTGTAKEEVWTQRMIVSWAGFFLIPAAMETLASFRFMSGIYNFHKKNMIPLLFLSSPNVKHTIQTAFCMETVRIYIINIIFFSIWAVKILTDVSRSGNEGMEMILFRTLVNSMLLIDLVTLLGFLISRLTDDFQIAVVAEYSLWSIALFGMNYLKKREFIAASPGLMVLLLLINALLIFLKEMLLRESIKRRFRDG